MPGLRLRWLRFIFYLLYTRLSFAYDAVSALVSLGEWQAWVHAALPFLRGPRILELGFGPGHLHLTLRLRGFQAVGLDLSPYMVARARLRLERYGLEPQLVLGRAQALPFPAGHFDDLVMTFPPGLFQPGTLAEMARVLKPAGRLVWVDGGRVKPTGFSGWLVNAALDLTYSFQRPSHQSNRAERLLSRIPQDAFHWRFETIDLPRSTVLVILGTPALSPASG